VAIPRPGVVARPAERFEAASAAARDQKWLNVMIARN
jgi:hypothetical protein